MPSAQEASGTQSQIEAALDSGLNALSQRQQVQFQRYQRFPLQSDGSVFWVATGELMTATGSLHYATDREQNETETLGRNSMIFSSESEITRFNAISPTSMWIGTWAIPGAPPLRVAFSQRSNLYREADLYHYSGHAVYPTMETQIIENAEDLPAGPIVSNSLPIWLSQNKLNGQAIAVYPSFLAEENLRPPYIVAHIEPETTEALGAFPIIGPWPGVIELNSGASPLHELAASQLCRDEVILTLYGFDNQAAYQYFVALIEASMNGVAPFGFANSPTIRDQKRPQVEISALAQKKTIHISANYNQGTMDALARRLIIEALPPTLAFIGGVTPMGVGSVSQNEQMIAGEGSVFS